MSSFGFNFNGEWITYYHRIKDSETSLGVLPKHESDVIVCEEYLLRGEFDTKVCHRFFALKSLVDLACLIDMQKDAHLYEVIRGDRAQKPFFDLDIEADELDGLNPYSVLEDLIECIMKSNVSKNSILVCETHCPNKSKYSFHVIVQRMMSSCRHAGRFAEIVRSKMRYPQFVDDGVYNKNRQFRLVYSSKLRIDEDGNIKTPRVKKINRKYTTCRLNDNRFDILSTFISNVAFLEYLDVDIPDIKPRRICDIEELSKEQCAEIEKMIPDYAEIEKMEGQIITLKRIRPSFCEVCERIHHHQNPYLYITFDSLVEICCRRSSQRTILGKLTASVTIIQKDTSDSSDSSESESGIESVHFAKEVAKVIPPRPFARPC